MFLSKRKNYSFFFSCFSAVAEVVSSEMAQGRAAPAEGRKVVVVVVVVVTTVAMVAMAAAAAAGFFSGSAEEAAAAVAS